MSSASEDDRDGDDQPTPNGGVEDAVIADDDLFGDDDDEVAAPTRELDDEDLDSGDDEGRKDRVEPQYEEPEQQNDDFIAAEIDLGRHPIPEPSDGEGYLLKIPQFLSVEPVSFSLEGFQPPTTDHHETEPSSHFSAYKTAQTTIRWRHSPSKPAELQSNARILRWSDGSLTMQLASEPTVQYEIMARALAPPQRNPKKPTPISKPGRPAQEWKEKQEQFTYLASASEEAFIVRVTNKITASLQVNTTGDNMDEALERLQSQMAAARGPGHGVVNIDNNVADPEALRKGAELAEKEKLRAQKRLESQQNRERERSGRVPGRSGGRAGGLTVGGLEEEGGTSASRRAAKKAPRRRRNDEYSDEEEEFGYRGREDAYDMEDGFVAESDEDDEDAEGESDDDMDVMIERREKEQQDKRGATPKRDRREVEDEDVAGNAQGSPVGRSKRRKVIDDDDDE